MIASDQFTNAPDELVIAFSSRSDGTVLDRSKPAHTEDVIETRRAICAQVGVPYENVVYQRIEYSADATYDVIKKVDASLTTAHVSDVAADGLFTAERGVGLFLPVADCIVTVIYDPVNRYLAQLHMGRHSTLTSILYNMVEVFKAHGSNPADLLVWMEPSVTKAHYRLEYFDYAKDPAWQDFIEQREDGYYLDMQGFNRAALIEAGIVAEHITISPIDTFENENYFSHFRGDTHGRFAGLAMMR